MSKARGRKKIFTPPQEQDFGEGDGGFLHKMVDSFIGWDAIPQFEKLTPRFLLDSLWALRRLILPNANQIVFAIGFWLMRCIGALILGSWLYYGFAGNEWDRDKAFAGLVTFLFGPFSLRVTEFLLEYFLLSGVGREHWSHFWSFKRMVAPRTIQGAFYLGFWVLMISGAAIVCAGFHDLIVQPKAGSIRDAVFAITDNMNDADSLAREIVGANNPIANMIRKKMTPTLQEQLERIDKTQPLPSDLKTALTSETRQIVSGDQNLQEISKHRKEALPLSFLHSLPSDLRDWKTPNPNAFSRILKGFLLLMFGPLLLR
ncbi:TPA: hypothetical protein DDW35_00235, partial [Candidatus Sumerlaeota bacterium]|nr:hypothetical protein [Candidatus Sumerlaeota bacterium]